MLNCEANLQSTSPTYYRLTIMMVDYEQITIFPDKENHDLYLEAVIREVLELDDNDEQEFADIKDECIAALNDNNVAAAVEYITSIDTSLELILYTDFCHPQVYVK